MSKKNGKPAKPKNDPPKTIPPPEEPKAVVEEPKPAVAETAPKPTPPGKLTPEEIAAYDAETASLVADLEAEVGASKAEWISAKEVASAAKKAYESDVDKLREMIRDRKSARGKRPQKTLLDVVPKAKWRTREIDELDLSIELRDFLDKNHTGDLGELYGMLTSFTPESGPPFGMPMNDASLVREAIQKLIDAEDASSWRNLPIDTINKKVSPKCAELLSKLEDIGCTLGTLQDKIDKWDACAKGDSFIPPGLPVVYVRECRRALKEIINAEAGPAPPEAPELWREYPIDRWITHGLRSTDVARLHAGEIKGENKAQPIMTVGDLTNFMTPNKANPGWNRKWTDIKGIGPQAADRLDEANALFFRWWNADGEAEFKKEKGYATAEKRPSEVPDDGDEPGEDSDDSTLDNTSEVEPIEETAAVA